jgi:hypothetical protein
MSKELGKGAAAIFSEAESQTLKEEFQHSEVEVVILKFSLQK